ncbi:hypothetical protein AMTR_s00130p00095330 [Amborella trichopoda]|uniref:Uncharacterized protein n=1 Tax=Amborella trichopoda TaxID=13333 RepID=W1NQG5_AMBTC|nr:hypothetical protein AMTR_s00130p00095330 [Amborella trichopoda]
MGIANDKEIYPMMSSKVIEDKGKHQFICSWESEENDFYQYKPTRLNTLGSKLRKKKRMPCQKHLYFPPANAA